MQKLGFIGCVLGVLLFLSISFFVYAFFNVDFKQLDAKEDGFEKAEGEICDIIKTDSIEGFVYEYSFQVDSVTVKGKFNSSEIYRKGAVVKVLLNKDLKISKVVEDDRLYISKRVFFISLTILLVFFISFVWYLLKLKSVNESSSSIAIIKTILVLTLSIPGLFNYNFNIGIYEIKWYVFTSLAMFFCGYFNVQFFSTRFGVFRQKQIILSSEYGWNNNVASRGNLNQFIGVIFILWGIFMMLRSLLKVTRIELISVGLPFLGLGLLMGVKIMTRKSTGLFERKRKFD